MSEQSDPTVLWLAADIARELGISPSLVANWSHYDKPYTPTPHATTPGGTRLWNEQQVKDIIAAYHKRNAVTRARRARSQEREEAKQRADRMVRILTGAK